jgi:LysM repeat protein
MYTKTNQFTSNRTTTHKRIFRLGVLLILIAISFSFGALVQAYASNGSPAAASETPSKAANSASTSDDYMKKVVVVTGDTLWGIAKQNAPEDQDIREYIYRIQKTNKLKSSVLHAGQTLILP